MRASLLGALSAFLLSALPLTSNASAQSTYTLGGPTDALAPGSHGWAWSRELFREFRAAVESPHFFGPHSVPVAVHTRDLDVIDASTLSGLDGFIAPYWRDSEITNDQLGAILDFFFSGGDLLLFTDTGSHDKIAETLGFPTIGFSTSPVADGYAPLVRGPFGNAYQFDLGGIAGVLDRTAVRQNGGSIAAVTGYDSVLAARWNRGSFGPNAGALVIIGDVNTVTTPAAEFNPPNGNGLFALNTMAFLANREAVEVVAGPHSRWTWSGDEWRWDGGDKIQAFRDALEDETKFSRRGDSPVRVYTERLYGMIDREMMLVDTFVATAWRDEYVSSSMLATIERNFLEGMNLYIMCDDDASDAVTDHFGIPVENSNRRSRSDTRRPIDNGPFGSVSYVEHGRDAGRFLPADFVHLDGVAVARNSDFEDLAVYFPPEAYAPGSGTMLLSADTQIVATPHADYDGMNANAKAVLNAFHTLITDRVIRIGGPSSSVAGGPWGWSGLFLEPFRDSLEIPFYFGPQGMASGNIRTVDITTFSEVELAKLDAFVTGYWLETDISFEERAALIEYFFRGGNLLLCQDGPAYDSLGHYLGLPTYTGSPTDCTGDAPLFDGNFGSPDTVLRAGGAGHLNVSHVNNTRGTPCAFDPSGNIAAALWTPEQYAVGTGALLILCDVDMISTLTADYFTLNANAQFALNAASWITDVECESPFTHYGFGSEGGGNIIPAIRMDGCPMQGYDVKIRLDRARGGTNGFLLISTNGRGSIPFSGIEILVAAPFGSTPIVLGGPAGIPGAGTLTLETELPSDLGPVELPINLQALFFDDYVPSGFSATEGVEFTIR